MMHVVFLWLSIFACEPNGETLTGTSQTNAQTDGFKSGEKKAVDKGPLIIILGDSLTAGYGLPLEKSFPALIQKSLTSAGVKVQIRNAGVSGDTSAGGIRRLKWMLKQQPDLLILELGGNDALRGQPIANIKKNLATIIEECQKVKVPVMLAGIQIPTNYGPEYGKQFSNIYPALAKQYQLPLIPFLLEGVAGIKDLNLPDGIHPNAEGQVIVAKTVQKYIEQWLADRKG